MANIDEILQIHKSDPLSALSTREIVSFETESKLTEYFANLDPNTRFEMALQMAERNVRELVKYFSLYRIETYEKKLQILKIAFENNPRRALKNFANWGEVFYLDRLTLARIGCIKFAEGIIKYIDNFDFTQSDKLEILKSAILYEPKSALYSQNVINYLVGTASFSQINYKSLQIFYEQNKLELKLSTKFESFSKFTNRAAAIAIIMLTYLANRELSVTDKTVNPVLGVLATTTKIDLSFLDLFSAGSKELSDFIDVIFDLARNCNSIIELLHCDRLQKSFGIEKEVLHLFEYCAMIEMIDPQNKELREAFSIHNFKINQFNLLDLISKLKFIYQSLTDRLFQNNENIDYMKVLDFFQNIGMNRNTYITLATRFFGKKMWNDELNILKLIISAIYTNEFRYLKYYHPDALPQIYSALKNEVLNIWVNDYSAIHLIRQTTQEDTLTRLISLINTLFTFEYTESYENLDLTKLNDKETIKVLKNFSQDISDWQNLVLSALINCKDIIQFRFTFARIKSLKECLRFEQTSLNQISQLLMQESKSSEIQGFIFTIITDTPEILLNLPTLMNLGSCHHPKSGTNIDSLLSYLIDANVKVELGFLIPKSSTLNSAMIQKLNTLLINGELKYRYDLVNLRITFEHNGSDILELPLNNLIVSRILKLGETENGELGIRQEQVISQDHEYTNLIIKYLGKLFTEYTIRLNAKSDEAIKVAKTRNPLGTYSGLAGGPLPAADYIISKDAIAAI